MATLKQGDIIKTYFHEKGGHIQNGWRPALVISGENFHGLSKNLAIVCPITTNINKYPAHVIYQGKKIYGRILCDQIQVMDFENRRYSVVEKIDKHTLKKVKEKIDWILQ